MNFPRLRPYRGSSPVGAWLSGEALLNIRGDFGSVRDSRGWSQFSVFWLTLLDEGSPAADEWAENWKARGYTHIVLSHTYGYPGSPIAGRSFSSQEFVGYVRRTLDAGFSPILMLSDVPEEAPKVIEIVKALKAEGLLPFVLACPAWEPVPTNYWTSKQLSDLLIAMKKAGGDEIVIAVHLQPGRWSMSSHPLESDDPWHGDEQGCWKSHGGEHVQVFLYQTEHEGWDQTPMEWENRFHDGVPRMCNGMNGWRKMRLCFFETVLYNDYRNEFGKNGEAFARKVASKARDIAKEYGAVVSFGNGAPA